MVFGDAEQWGEIWNRNLSLAVSFVALLQLQTSSNVKASLPRPEDFSKALYSFDIGQNDLHAGLKTMTEDQLKASFPNIISMLAQAVKVTERWKYICFFVISFSILVI